jgi:hypothetical protein
MLKVMYTYFLRAGINIKIPKSLTNEEQQWVMGIYNGAYKQYHFMWNMLPDKRKRASALFREVVLKTLPECFK